MIIVAEIICWISVGLMFHSYVLFPILISMAAKRKKINKLQNTSDQPFVSILMSAYNEESVIEEKINSIIESNYPSEKYEILVGSDCSSDHTDSIMRRLSDSNPKQIKFLPFSLRQGKPNIINQLIALSKGSILILTDANVMFDVKTIAELVTPFEEKAIGLVDSQMINKGAKESGISFQEKAYISREVSIKHNESLIWGSMMGPFGGCFAIRKNLYEPVPSNFLVDDFFLNMIVLEKGFKAINNPQAFVYEDVSNDIGIEYRRKIRIASGNFQNLARFKKLLWPPLTGVSFSFISHKIIRWLGPLLILLIIVSLATLLKTSYLYLTGFIISILFLIIPLLDYFLKKLSIHISLFRFITHFCAMNLAMLVGLVRYIKGVKSNVWEPTKRNQ